MQNLEFRKTRDTNYDAPKGRGQEWLLICAPAPCSGRGVLGGTAQKVCKYLPSAKASVVPAEVA